MVLFFSVFLYIYVYVYIYIYLCTPLLFLPSLFILSWISCPPLIGMSYMALWMIVLGNITRPDAHFILLRNWENKSVSEQDLCFFMNSLLCFCRTQLTSILKLSLLTLPITLSETTRESTGFATLSTSTGSFVVLHQQGRNTEVFVVGVTWTTRTGHLAGLHGRGTRLSPCADTVDFGYLVIFLISFVRFFFWVCDATLSCNWYYWVSELVNTVYNRSLSILGFSSVGYGYFSYLFGLLSVGC